MNRIVGRRKKKKRSDRLTRGIDTASSADSPISRDITKMNFENDETQPSPHILGLKNSTT